MNQLNSVDDESTIRLVMVPKIGHSSAKLTPTCQREFTRLNWVEPSPLQTFREWQDQTGKFKLKAIFVDQDERTVNLKTTTQQIVSVEKAKLCDDDQALLDQGNSTRDE